MVGAILLAMEDGFRLHRLIDPEHPADSFCAPSATSKERSEWIDLNPPPPSFLLPFCLFPPPSIRTAIRRALCNCPATARTLRGEACQIAIADRALTAMPIAKAEGVAAGKIVQKPGRPRPRRAAGQRRQHDGAENAAVLLALKISSTTAPITEVRP